jgi:hypothetical protein
MVVNTRVRVALSLTRTRLAPYGRAPAGIEVHAALAVACSPQINGVNFVEEDDDFFKEIVTETLLIIRLLLTFPRRLIFRIGTDDSVSESIQC